MLWLALVVFSWALAMLPFVFWGWRGLYVYAGAAGLYLLACQRERRSGESNRQ
jgi:hypothetical protein